MPPGQISLSLFQTPGRYQRQDGSAQQLRDPGQAEGGRAERDAGGEGDGQQGDQACAPGQVTWSIS